MDRIQNQIFLLKNHADPEIRRHAAGELRGFHTPEILSALTESLGDEASIVREAVTAVLVEIGGDDVAECVAPLLAENHTRTAAAEILYRLGRSAIPYLHNSLKHSDAEVRRTAVDILGQLRNASVLPAVIELLSDEDPSVVISAIDALGIIGNDVAVPELIHVFDEEQYTRAAVAEALGRIRGERATEFLCQSFERLIASDEDPLTLFGIIGALGSIGDPKAFSLLGTHVPHARGKQRRMILAAMVWIADKCGLTLEIPDVTHGDFVELLDDADLRVRLSAVQILSRNADSSVTKELIQALGSSEYFDVVLFGILNERPETLSLLIEMLPPSPPRQQRSQLLLLRALLGTEPPVSMPKEGVTRVFELMTQYWDGLDDVARRALIEIGMRINEEKTLDVLSALIAETDPWRRTQNLEVISSLDNPKIRKLLVHSLRDHNRAGRVAVEWLLEGKETVE